MSVYFLMQYEPESCCFIFIRTRILNQSCFAMKTIHIALVPPIVSLWTKIHHSMSEKYRYTRLLVYQITALKIIVCTFGIFVVEERIGWKTTIGANRLL